MNIDELTDQEKSVALARVMAWKIHPVIGQHIIHRFIHNVIVGDEIIGNMLGDVLDLYDPANMALAWRVLNWAIETDLRIVEYDKSAPIAWEIYKGAQVFTLPPADAQRAWLDKILELAIEAGLTAPPQAERANADELAR